MSLRVLRLPRQPFYFCLFFVNIVIAVLLVHLSSQTLHSKIIVFFFTPNFFICKKKKKKAACFSHFNFSVELGENEDRDAWINEDKQKFGDKTTVGWKEKIKHIFLLKVEKKKKYAFSSRLAIYLYIYLFFS